MRYIIACGVAVLSLCMSVHGASVQSYTDKSAWFNATGQATTIDFAGYPNGTPVLPEHYADIGIAFTGEALFYLQDFQGDWAGIKANNNTLFAHFDVPQRAIAVDYPGTIRFRLFFDDELIYTSGTFLHGFTGLVSDAPFDRVEFFRHSGSEFVFIDDLHFGLPIPAPGALGVFALAAFITRSRRRA